MRELRVRTWAELHEVLFDESWNPELERHRSRFAFRGMPSDRGGLGCGLARLTAGACASLEDPLLRTFRRYARHHVDVEDSIWSWLAVAQHHGLPTRLLDWTFSPYVALHFMTENVDVEEREDGIVWTVDYIAARRLLPKKLARILDEESANVFTAEMLSRAARSLADFDALGDAFLAFFEPPSLDDRIVNQYALFSLSPRPLAELEGLETWLATQEGLARKIIVPGSLKWEIRDKLDQSNITERVLYPGLDGLSRWLRRYYMPRRRSEKDRRSQKSRSAPPMRAPRLSARYRART
jgi:hypothetical protein